jgi:hypothetical protein
MMQRFDDQFQELLEGQQFWFPCIGRVETFDAATQTCEVTPLVSREGTSAPKLLQVPVVQMAGAGFEIDVHLQAGDFVLLVFCMTPVTLWAHGQDGETNASRPQLANAVAIPALPRITGHTAGTSPGVTIRKADGTISFMMDATGVKIQGDVEVTGNLSASGTMSAGPAGATVTLNTHTHGGVTIGSGSTAVPNPGT